MSTTINGDRDYSTAHNFTHGFPSTRKVYNEHDWLKASARRPCICHMGLVGMSISVYNYLCRYLVGTEKHVNILRLMNTISDNLSYDNNRALITSGSFGEGLEMRGSDLDIMIVLKHIEVHETMTSVVFNPSKTHFALITEDTKPGFTMLRLLSSPNHKMLDICKMFRQDYYLSNALFKNIFLNDMTCVEHGPCLSDLYGCTDFAYCLHSKSWVNPGLGWTIRSSNAWPNEDLKQMIIKHGVLFVPIGDKGSPNEELEWRISFSVAEKFLIYSFSHTQLLCYALMKILLKDVINADSKCKDLLCSYYLKTIVFWISEEEHPSVWTPANLIPCFMRCFRRLIYCVQYGVCPHYFIPENNLFENRIEGLCRKSLIDELNVLFSYGWRCVLLSDQISDVSLLPDNFQNDQIILFYEDINKLLKSNILTHNSIHSCKHNHFIRAVHAILNCNSKKLKYMYTYFMSLICNKHSQSIHFSSINCNKNDYGRYKLCLGYLLMNINHDATAGWLMLASFFYKLRQYNNSLVLILHSLSKCSKEKLSRNKKVSDIQRQLVNCNSLKKKGVLRMFKYVFLDLLRFDANSSLIPVVIRRRTFASEIPPVVYGYFLSFMCFYHLQNMQECRFCLRYLQWTISECYCIPNSFLDCESFCCLGRALQLIGDSKSAREAFFAAERLVVITLDHLMQRFVSPLQDADLQKFDINVLYLKKYLM